MTSLYEPALQDRDQGAEPPAPPGAVPHKVRRCSDAAERHKHPKGGDAPPFALSVLQVSQDPRSRGTGLCAFQAPPSDP